MTHANPGSHSTRTLSWSVAPIAALAIAALLLVGLSACVNQSATNEDDSTDAGADQSSTTTTDEAQPAYGAQLEEVIVTGNRKAAPRLRVRMEAASAAAPLAAGVAYGHPPQMDRERYANVEENGIRRAAEDPVSTFSVDVDTASYSNVRRFLDNGHLPEPDAVRTEELINYFNYTYAGPSSPDQPFALHTELGPSPWHPQRHLLHIGLQGYSQDLDDAPPMNLVFLVDVSGSMQAQDKLPLLKRGFKLLLDQLRPTDSVALVVYAGAAGVVLEPTKVRQRATIENALEDLAAGGSTNGGAGIKRAYSIARSVMVEGGVNRVVLATDGDFNVGTTSTDDLRRLVEREAATGVSLSILGFGQGNYNDALMQELAQNGNGNAAYIDTLHEARKVFVDQLTATLVTIARDVKIQVEFNPAVVAEYRLIGYETRALKREDFNNDQVDAGDIGAGHSVTAIYEIALAGSGGEAIEGLRYGQDESSNERPEAVSLNHEVAEVRLRYKLPLNGAAAGGEGDASRLIRKVIQQTDLQGSLSETSNNFRFSAAVAAFGQRLRGSRRLTDFNWEGISELARAARDGDPNGYRGEFLQLVSTAGALD